VVLRVGLAGSPDGLNPGAAMLSESYTLFALVYDALYSVAPDGSFQPQLASHASGSADGKVWTFRLRSGFVFHDGHPLTARDVAFSYRLYREHADFPLLHTYARHFQQVTAVDDTTVVLQLSQAIPNLESQLVFLYILPEHLWAAHAEGAAALEFANARMIGSGPFRMVDYRQGEFVRLAANPRHPLTPPRIDAVVFQSFANQDALVQALRTGQADMITELPVTALASLRRDPRLVLVSGVPLSPEVATIAIDQIAPADCPPGSRCSGHPALRDRQVRLALACATDKKKLIEVVLLGLGVPGLTLIPDGLERWYNSDLQDYPFDPAAANRILDQAGYLDADGDGVRDLPDRSRPLLFRLNWPSDSPFGPRLAQLLSAMWSAVGIGTQLQAMDPDALTSTCCPAFDFDLILWSWDSDPDPNLLLAAMTCAQIPTGQSETGYCNPQYDLLYERQAAELDPARRRQLVWQMQQLVHQDVVYVIPFYTRVVQAYRADRFTGWPLGAPRVALESPAVLTRVERLP
jgi:peptide/nickel transport system substrate-binding protein